MRNGIGIRAAVAATVLCCAGSARADEYRFDFDPGSGQLLETKADNRSNLDKVLSLIRDFGGSHGIQFVLLGEVPVQCLADLKCDAVKLLRQRVEAVSERVIALSGSGDSLQGLRWQPVPPATPHLEGLKLRIRDLASQVLSRQCPFRVQVRDPQLPPTIAPDGTDQDWVTIVGTAPVPVTDRTSIRIRSGAGESSQSELAARQVFKDHQTPLVSGSDQIQWSAAQLIWGEGGAEVIVEQRLVSRDITNEVLPWNPDGTSSVPSAADVPGCRIRFKPIEPTETIKSIDHQEAVQGDDVPPHHPD